MPRLEYDVVFTVNTRSVSTLQDELNEVSGSGLENASKSAKDLNKNLLRTAESAEGIGDSISLSSEDMDRFQQRTADASVAMNRMSDASERARTGTQSMSKSVNNSNQILFSFGDAMQDGAQFQQSFGAGARAVGNNLTFAAEQIALANQKTGSLGGTFKSLGSALMGPAGVVFLVNAAVTAITVWSNTASSAEKETKKFKDGLDQLNKSFERTIELQEQFGAFEDDPFGIVRTQASIREITEDLRVQRGRLKRVNNLEKERQDLLLQQSQTSDLSDQQKRRLANINSAITRLGDSEDIQENIKTLEQERFNLSVDLINTGEALADQDTQRARRAEQTEESYRSILESLRLMQGIDPDVFKFNIGLADAPEAGIVSGFQDTRTAAEKQAEQVSEFYNVRQEKAREWFSIENSLNRMGVDLHKSSEKAKTEITRREANARKALISQAASAVGNVLTAAFGESKKIRIATALIDTYASAQSAYASQLIPGDPSSLVRAKIAAGLAVASGLARVAQIAAVTPENASASGGGSSFSQGIQTTDINERATPNASTARNNQQDTSIVIEANNILPDTEFSKRAENGRKQRETDSIVVNRNR